MTGSNPSERPNTTQTLVIGLSGPSSSGKTTLARLLRTIFNFSLNDSNDDEAFSISLFIVHEDDFYKSDADIPYREWTSPTTNNTLRREQDWDCVESLDLDLLDQTTTHIKRTGQLPADFASKEDQNSVGEMGVSVTEMDALQHRVREQVRNMVCYSSSSLSSGRVPRNETNDTTRRTEVSKKELKICILEGFLLFPPPTSYLTAHAELFTQTSPEELVRLSTITDDVLDCKIFLPCSRQLTVDRRARRSGYVTLEGFWADPPGYVEELVWVNYKRDHGWLFDSPDRVDEGVVDGEKANRGKIKIGPGSGNARMTEVLDWGVGVVLDLVRDAIRQPTE